MNVPPFREVWAVAVCLISLAVASLAQDVALKIVVIEGENGVNIIDKKTAVKPAKCATATISRLPAQPCASRSTVRAPHSTAA